MQCLSWPEPGSGEQGPHRCCRSCVWEGVTRRPGRAPVWGQQSRLQAESSRGPFMQGHADEGSPAIGGSSQDSDFEVRLSRLHFVKAPDSFQKNQNLELDKRKLCGIMKIEAEITASNRPAADMPAAPNGRDFHGCAPQRGAVRVGSQWAMPDRAGRSTKWANVEKMEGRGWKGKQ